jgi:hypothetical protein
MRVLSFIMITCSQVSLIRNQLEEDQVPGVNDRHYDVVLDYDGTIPRSHPYTPTYMMHKFISARKTF